MLRILFAWQSADGGKQLKLEEAVALAEMYHAALPCPCNGLEEARAMATVAYKNHTVQPGKATVGFGFEDPSTHRLDLNP